MRVSKRGEYALRSLINLGIARELGRPVVKISELAEKENIPIKFLEAILLDLNDPSRVLRRLREPFLCPNEAEREGYVPNVVYSCGALVHGGRLILPYGMSDSASTIVYFELSELLAALRAQT